MVIYIDISLSLFDGQDGQTIHTYLLLYVYDFIHLSATLQVARHICMALTDSSFLRELGNVGAHCDS
jgi:hypothetical protein